LYICNFGWLRAWTNKIMTGAQNIRRRHAVVQQMRNNCLPQRSSRRAKPNWIRSRWRLWRHWL